MSSNNIYSIHYSQQIAEVGGYIFNKGEDALPFVCDEFMLVADGLGGDGFYAHTQMNPLMWDKKERQKLFNVPEYDDELVKYFDRLFKEMDRDSVDGKKPLRYIENPKYELHSGYFGSRLAAYSFVYLLKHDDKFKPCNLFQTLDAAQDEAQYRKALDEYSSLLCDAIIEKMKLFAKQANLILEDDRLSAKLLPTTLSAAIYRNIGDDVQVICLWAGDSRIIAQLEDGCAQLTTDDEKDEGMTNLIFLDDKFKARLNVKEYRFKQPFALFAVSDGTFDDMGGSLCYERLVILDAMSSDSQEAMQQVWQNLFKIRSSDDSASIAYYFFGIDSMEASKSFVHNRVLEIDEKYLSQLPDILDTDYKIQLQQLKRETRRSLLPYRSAIKSDPNIIETYTEDERNNPSTVYTQALKEVNNEKQKIDNQIQDICSQIKTYYKQNWLSCRPISHDHSINALAKKLQSELVSRRDNKEQYIQKLDSLKLDMAKANDDLIKQFELGQLAAAKYILSCSHEGIDENVIEGICFSLGRIEEELRRFVKGRWEETEKDSKLEESIDQDKKALLSKEAETIDKFVEKAAFDKDDGAASNLPDKVKEYRIQIQALKEQKQQLEKERIAALNEAATKRAGVCAVEFPDCMFKENDLLERLSGGLKAQIAEIMNTYNKKAEALKEKTDLQNKFFAECEHHYMRYIEEV